MKSLCFATVLETHHANMHMEVVEKETQGHNEKKLNLAGAADKETCRES